MALHPICWSGKTAVTFELMMQLEILQDSECPKTVRHSLYYDSLRYLSPFRPWASPKGGWGGTDNRHTDRRTLQNPKDAL